MILDQFGKPIETRLMAREARIRRADSLQAAYDAAQTTNENRKHWRWADGNSAAAANSIEVRKTLRQRARYECLEANSFGKGICLTLTNDTISSGPSLQVTLPDSSQSRTIEQRWRQWCKATRLAAKLRTARLSKIIDGEAVILKTTNRRLRTPVQLDVRLVEADQLSTPGFVDGQPNKVDGIEFDDYGNPTNYHILKGHPGDVWPFNAWEKDDIDPDDIIHLFRTERPGQVRGIPEITPALPLFAMLRRFTLAVILSAETAASYSGVLQTQSSAFDSDSIDDIEPMDLLHIERGMLTSLPRGWNLSQLKPEQPTTTYEMFRNAILNEIARCVHMPSNKALADSSKYNYSSGRLDHQTYYEAIAIERAEWEINCLDRIFEWWLDEALMLDGYIDVPVGDEVPHVWRWPPNKDVDPESDAKASIELINAGLMTEEQYLIAKNIDPEAHYSQLVEQAARKRRLSSMSSAGLVETPGTESPTASGEPSEATEATAAPTPPPTGEFANMTRQQMQRNVKAIDDAITRLDSGEWSPARARVFLSSIGLQERTIENLLSEYLQPVAAASE